MSPDRSPETSEAAANQKARPAGFDTPAYLLFAGALALGLALVFLPAAVAFAISLVAGIAGAVACGLLARRSGKAPPAHSEPWRFDGFCVVVATLALLALGASIGPEAAPVAWLLVALLVALAMAGIGAPRTQA